MIPKILRDLVRDFIDDFQKLNKFEDFLKLGVSPAKVSLLKQLKQMKQILQIKSKDFNLSPKFIRSTVNSDFHTWDGQFSNNGWMMECPHPITKLNLGQCFIDQSCS